MALRQPAPPGLLSHVLAFSAARSPLPPNTHVVFLRDLYLSQTISTTVALPFAVHSSLSWFWSQLWDSILRAVPKKKTSHRKKRQRFMAGKALKDVTNLNTCSACGNVKRAHLLCPYCVKGGFQPTLLAECASNGGVEIRSMWTGKSPETEKS